MEKRVLSRTPSMEYVLFDSCFYFLLPVAGRSMVGQIAGLGIHVICYLKPMPPITCFYNGGWLTLKQIYRKVRKRRGKAHILASTEVIPTPGIEVRIVFVRHSQTKG